MKIKNVFLLWGLSVLSACQTAVPLQQNPEAIIYNSSPQKVKSAITNACVMSNYFLEAQTDNSILCSGEANMMAQVLMGTKYGSGVSANIRFLIIPMEKNAIKVVGKGYFENQNAFGGVRKDHVNSGPLFDDAQYIIDQAKQTIGG